MSQELLVNGYLQANQGRNLSRVVVLQSVKYGKLFILITFRGKPQGHRRDGLITLKFFLKQALLQKHNSGAYISIYYVI